MRNNDLSYCFNSWQEFTALSPEEELLMKMAKKGTLTEFTLSKIREELRLQKEREQWQNHKNSRAIICFETDQIFSCAEECAKFYDTTLKAVYRALDCTRRGIKYRLKRQFTLSYYT